MTIDKILETGKKAIATLAIPIILANTSYAAEKKKAKPGYELLKQAVCMGAALTPRFIFKDEQKARDGMIFSIPLSLGMYHLWDHYDKKEKD